MYSLNASVEPVQGIGEMGLRCQMDAGINSYSMFHYTKHYKGAEGEAALTKGKPQVWLRRQPLVWNEFSRINQG